MREDRDKVLLGTVVEIASGQVDPREAPYRDMIHVGGDNIESHTGRLVDLRTAGEQRLISGKFLFDERDILYSKIRPALNKVVSPDFKGICSADIYPLRPINGRICKEYLVHLLRSDDFLDYTTKCSSRTNIPKINREALFAYEADLPPLPEQRRIAAILDKADAIRRRREEGVRLTEELLRSTFLEMFGDPVTNPKELPTVHLGDIADEMTYGTSQKCDNERDPSALPVLRIPNIFHGRVDWSDLKYASLGPREVEQLTLSSGDVLFVRTNGNPEYIGRCAVFEPDTKCLFASYLIRVRLRNDALYRSRFLQKVVTMPSYRSLLIQEARTTAGNYNISTQGLRRLRLIAPTTEAQDEFLEMARKIDSSHRRREEATQEATRLLSNLVHRAFRGEL